MLIAVIGSFPKAYVSSKLICLSLGSCLTPTGCLPTAPQFNPPAGTTDIIDITDSPSGSHLPGANTTRPNPVHNILPSTTGKRPQDTAPGTITEDHDDDFVIVLGEEPY